MMIIVFNILYLQDQIIKVLEEIYKEYQELDPLLVNIIGKGQNFQQRKKTGKSLKKIMKQLHLIYYMYPTIPNKYVAHTNQNITMSAEIK